MLKEIVIAADVQTLEQVSLLAKAARSVPAVTGIKIGCVLGLRMGLARVARAVREANGLLNIIYDHQKAGTDIPAMGEQFAEVCADAGISSVIIFPQAGPTTLAAFVRACQKKLITPIVGLTMSHDRYLSSEGGWIDDSAPGRILLTATEAGVRDFVLPGNKPELTRRYSAELERMGVAATIYMPGIGTQGGDIKEACEAVEPHYARPIIGSAIYKAQDPEAAMKDFAVKLA